MLPVKRGKPFCSMKKYVKQNAQRIATSSNRDFLLSTTFMNENGQMVNVIMNESDNDTDVNLWIEGKATKLFSPAHSIQTVLL